MREGVRPRSPTRDRRWDRMGSGGVGSVPAPALPEEGEVSYARSQALTLQQRCYQALPRPRPRLPSPRSVRRDPSLTPALLHPPRRRATLQRRPVTLSPARASERAARGGERLCPSVPKCPHHNPHPVSRPYHGMQARTCEWPGAAEPRAPP